MGDWMAARMKVKNFKNKKDRNIVAGKWWVDLSCDQKGGFAPPPPFFFYPLYRPNGFICVCMLIL